MWLFLVPLDESFSTFFEQIIWEIQHFFFLARGEVSSGIDVFKARKPIENNKTENRKQKKQRNYNLCSL
jgi:hypothetical protein